MLLVVLAVLGSGLTAPEPGGAGGPFMSDRFSGPVLGSLWQPVTPHQVGDVRLAGESQGEGWLALSVPDGANHHPWTSNDSVRAVQQVWDKDLQVQAGFASMPFARYQMQGLTVAASAETFLRYEVHHDGAGLRLFASVTVDGVPTGLVDDQLPPLEQVHLRVTRAGSDWTLAWSPDGAEWSAGGAFSQRMAVAEVGPYAGSFDRAGNPVGFTALVDYVTDPTGSAPAPAPESPVGPDQAAPAVTGAAADLRPRSARLTWATDEVTTGRVEYGPTGAYGEQSDPTPAGLGHGLTLSDLEPDTSYHFRVVATDLSGNVTATEDAVFTTAADSPAGALVSDTFAAAELDPHWQPVTPLGVGTVARAGPAGAAGQLALTLPAGHNHDPWTANDAVRAVQALADADLSIEARFRSMPEQRNQMQGLTVGESRVTFLRFGVHSTGSGLRLFGSVTHDGTPTVVVDTGLPALASVSLRVTRAGDDWELSWSADGTTWTSAAMFTQRMVTAEAGPFAGSYDREGHAPAFTALVDQVDNAGPDSGGSAGGLPAVRNVSVDTSTNIVLVRWRTTATATGQVELGTDDSYGEDSATTTAGTVHSVALADLERDTTYHYRLVATDPDGQVRRTKDATFTTAAGNTGPTIDVWYGREQLTGPVAPAQRWVNVLGNARDADGVSSLHYSVNGNGPRPLTLGPDNRRLQWPGDFNADIPVDDLGPGTNQVTITATDGQGAVTTVPVTVARGPDEDTDLPYQVSWSGGRSPAGQAQVVDGRWTVLDGGLRTGRTGYDRVVAVGDLGWSDYEVTVPITVHELGPAAYSHLSGGPMIGLGLRWRGHTAVDDKQPAWGFYPTGAFAWYRFHEDRPRFELSGNDGKPTVHTSPLFEIGTTYLLKVRVETVGDLTRYQARLWPAGGPEPGLWQLEIEQPDGPESGSVALVAHQLDGTFGDVTVRPL